MVLANSIIESALSIMEKYPEITVIDKSDDNIMVDIRNAQFCLWLLLPCDYNDIMPFFTAVDMNGNFPHLMIKVIKLHEQNHRRICLYESETIVKSLFSSEEKIEFVIEQLLKLLNLSPSQKELEYQKEFLYYWNNSAANSYRAELFIITSEKPSWLNVYEDKDSKKRFVHSNIYLNDNKKLFHNTKVQALYIPIIDTRGILPPNEGNDWTIDNVLDILDNMQFTKISFETYRELSTYSFSKKSIFLVFEMPANNTTVSFCCEIIFKNSGTMKLLKKIQTNTECVRAIHTTRCDYEFLNIQIGNDPKVFGKKVAIIGIGSLGSYIANEIIRSGFKDLVLIDSDELYPENLMRHRGTFFWRRTPKPLALKFELEWFHPQINITAINKEVTDENILELLSKDIDLIIFAVGSSDIQLICNRVLKRANYSKPVLFCWLEGNGKVSHVLGIDYSKKGCYQCLFTNSLGNRINNKINVISDTELEHNIIRNGCGGTRIAYGNSILLQTSYMVLAAIKKVFSEDFDCNFIINSNGDSITETDDSFYERGCSCCNED
jgi:molybdopterin/thiamine biosynthesis adenylyltransferase